MTLTEIAQLVAERQGSPPQLAWGFARDTIDVIIDVLNSGDEVKISGLGTFKWVKQGGGVLNHPDRKRVYGPGWKLKFTPSYKLRKRRDAMPDDEMTKYGVVLDDEHTKEAGKGYSGKSCPLCGCALDHAGACPTHGTRPLEPDPRTRKQ